ncbi:hypothetical protein LptCag_2636 [Leptospirillum ferriphilum]|uniref:Uncharacterized protein n=3 Tax=Leptospirillum TaxID=179 RepID=A0A094WHN5_9BACT|nr:hypothetical protein LptCag_2636 [Leptospirillum ferriphilum]
MFFNRSMKKEKTFFPGSPMRKTQTHNKLLTLLVEWSNRKTVPDKEIKELLPKWKSECLDWSLISRELPRFAKSFLEKLTETGLGGFDWREVRSPDVAMRRGSVWVLERLQGKSFATGTFPKISPEVLDFFEGVRSYFPSPIDIELLGKCEICGRFLLSPRGGKRRSRACSNQHQAVLSSRDARSSAAYREKEKARNARRMAAVREAEKRVMAWRKEGKSPKEVQDLLWEWNEGNGNILGKRSLSNILEKGV